MPLFLKKELKNKAKLAIWKIEESETELTSKLSLFPEERKELMSMRSPKSRIGHLGARVALKQLLPPGEPVLSLKNQQGKPYLPHIPGYISLSHSGSFGVAMMDSAHPVGVDIEQINLKIKNVVHKFLKTEERQWIPELELIDTLYACWCVKESAFKWYGQKGISLKENMTVQPFRFQSDSKIKLTLSDRTKCFELSFGYEKIAGYMLAYFLNS